MQLPICLITSLLLIYCEWLIIKGDTRVDQIVVLCRSEQWLPWESYLQLKSLVVSKPSRCSWATLIQSPRVVAVERWHPPNLWCLSICRFLKKPLWVYNLSPSGLDYSFISSFVHFRFSTFISSQPYPLLHSLPIASPHHVLIFPFTLPSYTHYFTSYWQQSPFPPSRWDLQRWKPWWHHGLLLHLPHAAPVI